MITLPNAMILAPELPGLIRSIVTQANTEMAALQAQIDVLRKRTDDHDKAMATEVKKP